MYISAGYFSGMNQSWISHREFNTNFQHKISREELKHAADRRTDGHDEPKRRLSPFLRTLLIRNVVLFSGRKSSL